MKNAGKTEDWLIERASGVWRKDPLRAILELFPFGTDPKYSLVRLQEPWRSRYPNCEYGLDAWACEVCDRIALHVAEHDFDMVNAVDPIRVAVASGHGPGKLEPLDNEIDTPRGRRKFGELKVGDLVFGVDGQPTRIVGIPYRGVRPCYKVTFDDGSSVVVGREHLWTVQGRQQRRKDTKGSALGKWVTLETHEIIERGVLRKNGAVMARQWCIPRARAVQFPRAEQPLPPYYVGVFIGDGTAASGNLSVRDIQVLEHLKEIGIAFEEYRCPDKDMFSVTVHHVRGGLRTAGLLGRRSHERFIPNCYKYASVEQRWELFRGLIDSDAYIDKQGSISYTTTSRQLADDVVWLVRSLGGKAWVRDTVKKSFYYDDDWRRVYCKDAYNVAIALPPNEKLGYAELYLLPRVGKKIQERYLTRWIASIEPVGDKEGMCISVDRADGLYLTHDFIVTHNSFFVGALTWWIMTTRPNCKGTITATTMPQLEAKTWAQVASMQKDCLTGHWFEITQGRGSMRMYAKESREGWACTAQTSKEENSESFAGQHAASSTSFYIFDEASGIPDKIWEVAEGGLTDGEPMIFAFGNPTRASGGFYNCFHRDAARWDTFKVDSRNAQLTNKKQIAEWAEVYGEDSDFFKVRVRGEFPDNASVQFIPTSAVEAAMSREAPGVGGNSFKRAIVGLDIARFGDDASVIATRIGRDAASIPFKEVRKLDGPMVGQALAAHCGYLLDTLKFREVRVYFDRAGVGASVWDWLRYEYNDPRVRYYPVDFGAKAQKSNVYANKRIEMWGRMKEWLITGDGCLPKNDDLKTELISPEFSYNDRQQMVLERKKDLKDRIGCSPDRADALSLTFADEMADLVSDDVESGRRQSWRRTNDMDPTTALEREDTW